MSFSLRTIALATIGFALVALTGCSNTVAMQPAEDANNPLCSNVMVNLPDTIAANEANTYLDRQWTNAQSTAVWGAPSTIYFQCGVEVPAASILPCSTFQGMDWIIDDDEAPFFRMTIFGREPAIQVYFNSEIVSSTEVLGRIGKAAQDLPKTGACIDRPSV